MIDTFSANSLKILDKSPKDFENKFINGLELSYKTADTALGDKLHKLIYYFLTGQKIEKFLISLTEGEKEIWNLLIKSEIMEEILNSSEKFIEQPFFIKENLSGAPYYLTGRFDAVIKTKEKLKIIDWKTNLLPKNPNEDIQTQVYFEAAKKLFKTNSIDMIYYSLQTGNSISARPTGDPLYKIEQIVKKYLK